MTSARGGAALKQDGLLRVPCTHTPALRSVVQVLVLVLLSTLAAKGLLEGWGSVPSYCPRRGKRTLACFALGFAAFPMPELFPRGCCSLPSSAPAATPLLGCLFLAA